MNGVYQGTLVYIVIFCLMEIYWVVYKPMRVLSDCGVEVVINLNSIGIAKLYGSIKTITTTMIKGAAQMETHYMLHLNYSLKNLLIEFREDAQVVS